MTDLEIVKWLREEIDRLDEDGDSIFYTGLCLLARNAYKQRHILYEEFVAIIGFIDIEVAKSTTVYTNTTKYLFPVGEKQPRVEWLDEQIKKREA